MRHHDCKEFTFDGKTMWFHLATDTSNVLIEKQARACCWTAPTDDEDEHGAREAIPGAKMRVEIRHHHMVTAHEAEGVDFCHVNVTSLFTFKATSAAQLTLPGGKVIKLEADA